MLINISRVGVRRMGPDPFKLLKIILIIKCAKFRTEFKEPEAC